LVCRSVSLSQLVSGAYHLAPYQFTPPDWMRRMWLNVDAVIPAGATPQEFRLMEQNLLAERFKLAGHFDKKELPTFEMTVAKSGLKVQQVKPDEPSPDGITMGDYMEVGGRVRHSNKQTMADLAQYLTGRLGRPVFDATGLSGTYAILLNYVIEPSSGPRGAVQPPVAAADAPIGPTLLEAVQPQLGLRLEAKKSLIDVLVIDHCEKVPAGN
jgi:uncharacterized protein (TIGR03435 family)